MTKILIVEDEDSVLDPLELLLSKEGFSIETARNGREGLDKFWKVSPDLVLLDIMLPEVSGTEVCIGDKWLDVVKAEEYCFKFGIEFVPYEKIPSTIEAINYERDRDSIVAVRRGMGEGHKREGVVLRPPFEVRMNNDARIIAKHKRDDFRETKTPRNDVDPSKLKVLEEAEEIAEEWCVAMRLNHIINKMTVDGIEPDMSKMGDIIKNMIDDIYIEAKGEIVESREVQKAIGTKTVALYKQHLRNINFGDSNE